MAWINEYGASISTINIEDGSGDVAIYTLKELWKQAGWVVQASGDGLSSYNATGDTITSSDSGANGMGNTNAWFRIQDPGALREYVFQRGSATNSWKWLYSASDKFTVGTPSATVHPTANDQQGLARNSTSLQTMFQIVGGVYHMAAQNAAHNGVYAWWLHETLKDKAAGYAHEALMCCDAMDSNYSTNDNDPCVHYGSDDSPTATGLHTGTPTSTDHFKCWMRYGETDEEWNGVSAAYYTLTSYALSPSNSLKNPHTDKYVLMPPMWVAIGRTLEGHKGVGKYIRYRPGFAFFFPTIINDGTDNYLLNNNLALPGWPSGVVPVL